MISACSQAAVSKRLCLLAQYEELDRQAMGCKLYAAKTASV